MSVPLELEITEVTDPGEIGKYAFVLVLPTLVINEKVVCSGRFPSKEEVAELAVGGSRRKANIHHFPFHDWKGYFLLSCGNETSYGVAGRKVASRWSVRVLKKPSGKVRGV